MITGRIVEAVLILGPVNKANEKKASFAVVAAGVVLAVMNCVPACKLCQVESQAAAPGLTDPAVPDVAARVVPAAPAERFAV